MGKFFTYFFVAIALIVPIAAATVSPLLAWRQPVYIIAGFAGIISMSLLLIQPLLIGGYFHGLSAQRSRQFHRLIGGLLVMLVAVHVIGLWITSPPDVIDALLFASPTPFSVWGVIAMWAVFLTGIIAILRKRLGIRPSSWRILHTALVLVIITGTVIHALLIEGTMEPISKIMLSAFVLLGGLKVLLDLLTWQLKRVSRS